MHALYRRVRGRVKPYFYGGFSSKFVMLLFGTTHNLFVIRALRVVVTVLSSNMISSWCVY
jgi:hypothetical protein